MAFKWMRFLFAVSGDRTAIPGPTDVSGNVSYEQGYGPDYQRPKTDPLSKNIERDKMNSLFYDLTGNVQAWQLQSFPDWVPAADNGGVAVSYGIGAIVRYAVNGLYYQSTKAANTSTPGANADWVQFGGKLLNTQTITATQVYTPTQGTKAVLVLLQAAGGGGGGTSVTGAGQVAAGNGGGGGAFGMSYYTTGFAGVTVTIGAPGIGVQGANGTNAAASSFGALLSCPGGTAGGLGTAGTPVTLQGGGATSANPTGANLLGKPGGIAPPSLYLQTGAYLSGAGGDSFMGGGGIPVGSPGFTNGNTGRGNGGGGSGGCSPQSNGSTAAGGVGAPGICVIFEFG